VFALFIPVALMQARIVDPVTVVTVHIVDHAGVERAVMARASVEASEILAGIGVSVQWKPDKPRSAVRCASQADRAVEMTILRDVPDEFHAGARAIADVRAGSITMFYGRMSDVAINWHTLLPTFLAHVMAHELTHVLQRVCRHSDSGIMKARWTIHDYHVMEERPLEFTPADVALIHAGLIARFCAANAAGDWPRLTSKRLHRGDACSSLRGDETRGEGHEDEQCGHDQEDERVAGRHVE
jgi:hypothetical protein